MFWSLIIACLACRSLFNVDSIIIDYWCSTDVNSWVDSVLQTFHNYNGETNKNYRNWFSLLLFVKGSQEPVWSKKEYVLAYQTKENKAKANKWNSHTVLI